MCCNSKTISLLHRGTLPFLKKALMKADSFSEPASCRKYSISSSRRTTLFKGARKWTAITLFFHTPSWDPRPCQDRNWYRGDRYQSDSSDCLAPVSSVNRQNSSGLSLQNLNHTHSSAIWNILAICQLPTYSKPHPHTRGSKFSIYCKLTRGSHVLVWHSASSLCKDQ